MHSEVYFLFSYSPLPAQEPLQNVPQSLKHYLASMEAAKSVTKGIKIICKFESRGKGAIVKTEDILEV